METIGHPQDYQVLYKFMISIQDLKISPEDIDNLRKDHLIVIKEVVIGGGVQSLSRVQLCNPIDCSSPGFPVLHCLPEFAQTHVH